MLHYEDGAYVKEIHNARTLELSNLFAHGFELHPHVSAVCDWQNPEEVSRVYYREIEELVKRATGATLTVCGRHVLRGSDFEKNGNYLPFQRVHNDYADTFGDDVIRTFASNKKGFMRDAGITEKMLQASRLVMINCWRSIRPEPVQGFPLAVVDKRTVRTDELETAERAGPGSLTYVSRYSPWHTFYYFPEMTSEEVLLFRTFDSGEKPFQPTLHSAFKDESAPKESVPRRSCDVRVLCLLPK